MGIWLLQTNGNKVIVYIFVVVSLCMEGVKVQPGDLKLRYCGFKTVSFFVATFFPLSFVSLYSCHFDLLFVTPLQYPSIPSSLP